MDRKFRLPRVWSNRELKKFAHLFTGEVVNVSGWKDGDKENGEYRKYFINKRSYTITNYKTEAMGFQGQEGEVFLDLEKELPKDLVGRFDVVFNHTVLEHVFEVQTAFRNLCLMSKDIVILIVPFLQQMHTDYGDYWRMTPLAVQKMFAKNGMKTLYLSFNDNAEASVYIFAIASREPKKWAEQIPGFIQETTSKEAIDGFMNFAGSSAIKNRGYSIKCELARWKNAFVNLVGNKKN